MWARCNLQAITCALMLVVTVAFRLPPAGRMSQALRLLPAPHHQGGVVRCWSSRKIQLHTMLYLDPLSLSSDAAREANAPWSEVLEVGARGHSSKIIVNNKIVVNNYLWTKIDTLIHITSTIPKRMSTNAATHRQRAVGRDADAGRVHGSNEPPH